VIKVWCGKFAYVLGIYRPNKRGSELYVKPAMARRGTWHVRDWSEECKQSDLAGRKHSFSMKIEQETARSILSSVESMKEGALIPYSAVYNGVRHNDAFLALEDVILPSKYSFIRIIGSEIKHRFSLWADKFFSDRVCAVVGTLFRITCRITHLIGSKIPYPLLWIVQKSVEIPTGIFLNIIFATIGGGMSVHNDLRAEKIQIDSVRKFFKIAAQFFTTGIPTNSEGIEQPVRIFNSIWQILDYRRSLYIPHPHRRAHEVFPEIRRWQEEIGDALAKPDRAFREWSAAQRLFG
jgi:hypothetical protein